MSFQFQVGKRCCLVCHFFVKAHSDQDGVVFSEISHRERQALGDEKDSAGFTEHSGQLACFNNIWSWDLTQHPVDQKFRETVTRFRGESCFFYRFVPGMKFTTCQQLQQRQSQWRLQKTNRFWTKPQFVIPLVCLILVVAAIVICFILQGF